MGCEASIYAEALSELVAILDYIGQRSPQGAKRVKSRIQALTALIEEQPFSGQKTSETILRRVVATPYPCIIFYEVKPMEVVVVGVRHGARDPDTMP